ncbi:MAG: hypothetical protein JWM86_1985 [Thermoleophilia bacterium]|nr:hypothetical protein [Thermoleophilia bacterium]
MAISPINIMRTWIDDATLAVTRADEAGAALRGLADDASAADETMHAIGGGMGADDPFDAALALADDGVRGIYDGWTKSDAAYSLLNTAISKHPGGEGYLQLQAAREAAEQASGDVGHWIARGARTPVASLEASVAPQLDRIRTLAQDALRAAGG